MVLDISGGVSLEDEVYSSLKNMPDVCLMLVSYRTMSCMYEQDMIVIQLRRSFWISRFKQYIDEIILKMSC